MTIKSLIINDIETVGTLTMAEAFNDFFPSVADELKVDESPCLYVKINLPNSAFLSPIAERE